MGMTAEQFKDIKEQLENPEEMKAFLADNCIYKSHSIVIKAQNDQYRSSNSMEGDQRVKYTAIKVTPVNYKEDNKMLLKRLDMYSKMDDSKMRY